MNFPFFIARRYLFSKKSTHAINVISGISVIGVAVATMALVVTLSVFNGFQDLIASFFTSFDPQLKVVPVKGKTAPADDPVLTKIRQLPQIEVVTECVEDQALAIYHGRQAMVKIKGVEDNFSELTHIKEILIGDGSFSLHAADMDYGILGIRLAETLGTGFSFTEPIHIYAPRREGQLDMANPNDAFEEDELYSPGVLFNVKQSKYDRDYILTSISFARRIFGQQGMVSALELRLKPGSNFESVKREIRQLCVDQFLVKDRYEQQDDTFQIMKIEKLIAYAFLTFILIVACFNIIGSLSMLIIDKKDDVVTLRNLGSSDKQIVRIFLFEGRMISALGAVIGVLIGLLLCWIQQTYGIVALGSSSGNFVVDAYPVSVHPEDIVLVFITVLVVGFLSVWYPVRYFAKRLLVFALLLAPMQMHAEKFVFTTAWTAQSEFAGYYVAKEKGFYSDLGLDVVIQHPSLTSTAFQRLQTDQCDAAMFSMMSAMDFISQGIPLVNIFQDSMNSSNILVSRWCTNPLQMKGKKVAIFNSDLNYLLFIMSKMQGLDYEWVRFTSGINVLLSGAVDATAVVSYNEYFQLLQAGFNLSEEYLYRFSEHDYNIQENGVYVKRDYYQSHRSEVSKFAIASRRGWEWTAAHPEEALEIVMKYVKAQHIPTNRVMQKLMLKEVLRLQIDRESKVREFRVRADMVRKASQMMMNCGMLRREVTYEELMGYE